MDIKQQRNNFVTPGTFMCIGIALLVEKLRGAGYTALRITVCGENEGKLLIQFFRNLITVELN